MGITVEKPNILRAGLNRVSNSAIAPSGEAQISFRLDQFHARTRAANPVNRVIVRGVIDNYDVQRGVRRLLQRVQTRDRFAIPVPVDENASDHVSLRMDLSQNCVENRPKQYSGQDKFDRIPPEFHGCASACVSTAIMLTLIHL